MIIMNKYKEQDITISSLWTTNVGIHSSLRHVQAAKVDPGKMAGISHSCGRWYGGHICICHTPDVWSGVGGRVEYICSKR